MKSRTRFFSEAIAEIGSEYFNACRTYPMMNSAHEGFAVLKEEMDELWDEIKKKPSLTDHEAIKLECIQVGAMAIRFYTDVVKRWDD